MTCGLIHCISLSLSGSSELKLKQACNLVHTSVFTIHCAASLSLTDPLIYLINWQIIALWGVLQKTNVSVSWWCFVISLVMQMSDLTNATLWTTHRRLVQLNLQFTNKSKRYEWLQPATHADLQGFFAVFFFFCGIGFLVKLLFQFQPNHLDFNFLHSSLSEQKVTVWYLKTKKN